LRRDPAFYVNEILFVTRTYSDKTKQKSAAVSLFAHEHLKSLPFHIDRYEKKQKILKGIVIVR